MINLIKIIDSKKRLLDYWKSSGIVKDKKVLEAFKAVPREKFILKKYRHEAYGDYPLSIGENQTISQPTTVMIMTEALELKEGDKVLEIGTGSGYQAAMISELVGDKGKVITTEIIPELAEFAQKNIEKLKLKNVKIINYDGSRGYEKQKPYDKIIITAACPEIPPPVIDELEENGIIIAPVGNLISQQMVKGIKKGKLKTRSLGYFVFVPLKGKYGY
ncbi:protein-L-isoaspartate(D-aspartate) O-methyltransferase [Candidatus Woesearchaeota archaeon]|nr:protein-L-isoaspartate(D-aspartate) O-methyltransferase [Candidatus Woesearchaeota archaeon]